MADEGPLSLLLGLGLATARILFIYLARPSHRARLGFGPRSATAGARYQPSPRTARRRPDGCAGANCWVKWIKQLTELLIEKAEGNPFFVEELIRSLIETKQIVRSSENSHWRAASQDAKLTLPNTLRGVLSARIDRLPEATKHVLQNAAVIGDHSTARPEGA
jgi:hypothetical protein